MATSDTKVGLSQMNKPAPLWYRRLFAAILFLVPTISLMIKTFWHGSQVDLNNVLLVINMGVPPLFSAISMILGNGQYYVPSNQAIDEAKDKQP